MNERCGHERVRVKVRGTSSEAAPLEVAVLMEVEKPAGAGRHGLAVEVVGVLCRILGDSVGSIPTYVRSVANGTSAFFKLTIFQVSPRSTISFPCSRRKQRVHFA